MAGKERAGTGPVVASPGKPVSYMDRMDVLAMRYVPNEAVARANFQCNSRDFAIAREGFLSGLQLGS